jgi:hypothetical protein
LSGNKIGRDNPLLESNENKLHDGEIWLKGNLVLLALNLSSKYRLARTKTNAFIMLHEFLSGNHLTMNTVKQFLLAVESQSTWSHVSDGSTSSLDFRGLCRLELKVDCDLYWYASSLFACLYLHMKGMKEISTKSSEYQTLEKLLVEKNPSTRFQHIREREVKELLDLSLPPASQSSSQVLSDRVGTTAERVRTGSTAKLNSEH